MQAQQLRLAGYQVRLPRPDPRLELGDPTRVVICCSPLEGRRFPFPGRQLPFQLVELLCAQQEVVCLCRDLPCSIVRLPLPACVELLSQLLEDAALELQTAAFGGELLLGRLDRGGLPDEVVGRPGNLRTRRLELPLSGPEARGGGLQLLLPPSEARETSSAFRPIRARRWVEFQGHSATSRLTENGSLPEGGGSSYGK